MAFRRSGVRLPLAPPSRTIGSTIPYKQFPKYHFRAVEALQPLTQRGRLGTYLMIAAALI